MWHLTQNRESRVLFSNHPYGPYIFTEFCFVQCTITMNYMFHSKTNFSTYPIPSYLLNDGASTVVSSNLDYSHSCTNELQYVTSKIKILLFKEMADSSVTVQDKPRIPHYTR